MKLSYTVTDREYIFCVSFYDVGDIPLCEKFLKFYLTNTAGENKITTGEQSSFSPSLPAKFAVSRVKNRCLLTPLNPRIKIFLEYCTTLK